MKQLERILRNNRAILLELFRKPHVKMSIAVWSSVAIILFFLPVYTARRKDRCISTVLRMVCCRSIRGWCWWLNGRRGCESGIKTPWVRPFGGLRGLGFLSRVARLFIRPIYSNVFSVLSQIFHFAFRISIYINTFIHISQKYCYNYSDHDRTRTKAE